jgi:ATP-dependent Clp protease ATP-binding subunit ClpB
MAVKNDTRVNMGNLGAGAQVNNDAACDTGACTPKKKGVAAFADDVVLPTKQDLEGKTADNHVARVGGAADIKDVFGRAKEAYAGDSKLEPEHIALQILEDRGITVPPDVEKAMLDSATRLGEGDGAGMSTRTRNVAIATSINAKEIPNVDDLFRVIISSPDDFATQVRDALQKSKLDSLMDQNVGEVGGVAAARAADGQFKRLNLPSLNALGDDLVLFAQEGLLDNAVGREAEIEKVYRKLGQRSLPSLTLVGERGVGKSAIPEGMAVQIVAGQAPPGWENARIFNVPVDRLANECNCPAKGGTRAVVDKIAAEIQQAAKWDPPVPIILFMDEAHQLMTGSAAAVDLVNTLKPLMARGAVKVIAATTLGEFKKHIRPDGALEDRIQPQIIEEPKADKTVQMVLSNLHKYAKFHGVEAEASAAQVAADLAHYSEMKRPRGPVNWLDAAGSFVKMQLNADAPSVRRTKQAIKDVIQAKEAAVGEDAQSVKTRGKLTDRLEKLTAELESLITHADKEKVLLKKLGSLGDKMRVAMEPVGDQPRDLAEIKKIQGEIDGTNKEIGRLPMRLYHLKLDGYAVAAAVADATGIALDKLQSSGGVDKKLANIEEVLGTHVLGQDEAKAQLAKAIRADKAKMRNPTKPIGVHFFAGPSGVGKTELAKAVAREYYGGENALIRFDCNEMMQEHELARLVGAPPGYVGFEGGSQLAEEIRKRGGHAVLLLDEIEKAHPSIFPLLMQLMDEGRLRDNEGKEVDCTNVQIIMTSNLAEQAFEKYAGDGEYNDEQAVKREFFKAFLERIPKPVRERMDDPVVFNPLSKTQKAGIFDMKFNAMALRMEQNNGSSLEITQEAKDHLLAAYFSPANLRQDGGRAMERFLDKAVGDAVAAQLLNVGIEEGSHLRIGLDKDNQLFLEPLDDIAHMVAKSSKRAKDEKKAEA